MSRLAKKTIAIPGGVNLERKGESVFAKGPKGEMNVRIPATVEVQIMEREVAVKAPADAKQNRADTGTTWALLRNAIEGVTQGFVKTLEIEGVGFRAAMEGGDLVLSLGYVNPVRFKVPEGVVVSVDKNVITVSGINKELVGQAAAKIRSLKKPEPYKGKGIRYRGEVVRRKVGKKATTGAAG